VISRRAVIAASVACCTAATAVSAVAADADRTAPLKRIIGTKEANVLRGTATADFIDGRGGNDRLYGLAGNDRLVGGAGADRIFCGRGRDSVAADRRDTVAPDCEVVSGGATPPPPPPPLPVVPEQLLGAWNRYVSDGTVIGADHVGVWWLNFDRNGVVVIEEPPGAHPPGSGHDTITATFSATASGDLVIAAGTGCTTRGVYHWELTEAFLRIQQVNDLCPPRTAVIPGDWSR
jgi:hypothetical protein